MRQRIKRACIWSLCFIWILGIRASAAEEIEFHIKNQAGKAGDMVMVPVELKNGKEVGGFDVKVYYDSESMEFQELKKGELIRDDGLFDYNHKTEEASIKIIYIVSDTIKADGTLVNLVFKLKKDCESLPLGMNLQEVVDSSEEGNVVTGQVTGTDSAYQAQIGQREGVEGNESSAGEEEVQGEEGKEEKDKEEKDSQKEDSEEKEPIIGEVKEEDRQDERNNKDNILLTTSIAVIILTAIAGIVMWKRKQ